MNESDTDANTKAIDSLLNFETVKYFGAEAREAARYDKAMARYERLSVRTYVSLAVLNAGQAVIFTVGMIAVLRHVRRRASRSGRNTVGDFVLLNVMMLQLYQPLNFMGMVYREIKQAIVDIERDVRHSRPEPGDPRPARRARRSRSPRARCGSRTSNSPTTPRGRSCAACRSRRRPGRRSRSSARRAPASRRSRGCCSASTSRRRGASPSTGRTSPR